MMTVQQLRDILEDFDPDDEVRLMMQPSYPFEYSLSPREYVVEAPEDEDDTIDRESFEPYRQPPDGRIVYLCEGKQLGYGTRRAWS